MSSRKGSPLLYPCTPRAPRSLHAMFAVRGQDRVNRYPKTDFPCEHASKACSVPVPPPKRAIAKTCVKPDRPRRMQAAAVARRRPPAPAGWQAATITPLPLQCRVVWWYLLLVVYRCVHAKASRLFFRRTRKNKVCAPFDAAIAQQANHSDAKAVSLPLNPKSYRMVGMVDSHPQKKNNAG